jgi:hypothetical protein
MYTKIVISVGLISIGLFTLLIWYVGSHEHIRFRPHMLEDWILLTIVILSFGTPLIIIIKEFKRVKK